MGSRGEYYDRNVTDRTRRTAAGFSDIAEAKMSKSRADAALLTRGRKIVCSAKSPIVYAFDVTGSMGGLPKIIFDKMPMMAGQLAKKGYLDDVMVSLSAVGDALSDSAPVQVCDFSAVKNLDEWLQRIWIEGGGGGQAQESYELTAYFYARMCEIPNAETPIFLFTGDEGFRETMPVSYLEYLFGGKHESTYAKSIFDELKRKFKGNVFLIHRRYDAMGGLNDRGIVEQWENALGKERVIKLKSDVAIADVTLGLFAIVSGKRTLEEYLQDMRTRENPETGEIEPQSEERIAEVKESLREFAAAVKPTKAENSRKKTVETTAPPETKKKKPGRIF